MLFVCKPKILHKHCLQSLLGVKMAPRETENNAYAKFWGDKQRALWYVMVFSGVVNRAFSITWPASMQIYGNKWKRLHKKRVQLPEDCLGTPTWPPFYCFATPIWSPWRHVKTLHWKNQLATSDSRKTGPSWLSQRPLGLLLVTEKRIGHWLTGASLITMPEKIAGHISVLVSYRL